MKFEEKVEGKKFNSENLAEANLENVTFIDSKFTSCDLSMVKINGASFQKVHFDKCKLAGLDFSLINSFAVEMSFKECLISNCVFNKLNLKEISFAKSMIKDSFFTDLNLEKADFSWVNFENTRFEDCKLNYASFLNATGYQIDPTKNVLKHTQFSFPEVASLLNYFEIEIK